LLDKLLLLDVENATDDLLSNPLEALNRNEHGSGLFVEIAPSVA
jgi:hypothetical protein